MSIEKNFLYLTKIVFGMANHYMICTRRPILPGNGTGRSSNTFDLVDAVVSVRHLMWRLSAFWRISIVRSTRLRHLKLSIWRCPIQCGSAEVFDWNGTVMSNDDQWTNTICMFTDSNMFTSSILYASSCVPTLQQRGMSSAQVAI